MIHLLLRFSAGRYHATPWDHHVNEGVVEWPPSPWRILRTLVSTLYTRAHRADPEVAKRALCKLSAAPSFTLPSATTGHTRHYLRQDGTDPNKTSMVFDTFVALDRGAEVVVHWPCELGADERDAVAALAAEVSYLGRAEAWTDVRVMAAHEEIPPPNCAPSDGRSLAGTQTVRVLCAADEYTLDDLGRTTGELQAEGWSDPPGTRYVFYRRPTEALLPQRMAPALGGQSRRPTVAEFSLEVGPGAVLPLLIDAVRVGDQFRRAVMSYFKGRTDRPLPVFSGRSGENVPRGDQHLHAHYIPDAREHRSRGQREHHRVTHMVVWAPEGFDEVAQAALRNVRYLTLPWRRADGETYASGRREGDLSVALTGFGSVGDFVGTSPLFGSGRTWQSRTPFVLPRHRKAHKDQPLEQLKRELDVRGFCTDVGTHPLDGVRLGQGGHVTRWNDFRRWREGDHPTTGCAGFTVTFKAPVTGPLLLGYGSHFGLGQFEAVDELP